ncbi:hypothetical protein, partial [Mesorhizobium sp.]|uniref:hypothetical protein n=1 Tax=Mesorhizobium sp. TaxID=1871066 RepID=UPI002580AD58
ENCNPCIRFKVLPIYQLDSPPLRVSPVCRPNRATEKLDIHGNDNRACPNEGQATAGCWPIEKKRIAHVILAQHRTFIA